MTQQTHVCDDQNVVVTVYQGSVTADQIARGFETLADLARDRRGLTAICDFRRCRIDFDVNELRSLAASSAKAARAGSAAKRAILAADDLTFGIGRMFCAFSGDQPTETRTFRDIGAMADWLDVDRAVIESRIGATI